ncbi:transmembrane 9 superfamily member 1 [Tiliqua scincoides]|uniref:transmembrane 9 superfamily member 1 n=1 Tax=Tiliqua scincoides TaxID=71010 RepID=UPI0034637DD8
MSGLGKIFGKGKKAKAPTPQEAIQKLRETEEVLVKKQEFLEQKIQQELVSAKKHGTKNKRAALQALKRKKRYEQQLAQIDGTLSTIEFQREALENATTNTEVLKTMSDAARAMKEAHQHMDIDKVDDLMAEITEQQDIAQQISDAISKPVGFGDDVDEDELLAELEEMEQEDLDKELLNVGEPTPELPSVPASRLPSVPASKVPAAVEDDDDEDMKQLAAWVSVAVHISPAGMLSLKHGVLMLQAWLLLLLHHGDGLSTCMPRHGFACLPVPLLLVACPLHLPPTPGLPWQFSDHLLGSKSLWCEYPLQLLGLSVFLAPLICPVLRVRLAAFFLSGVKVKERDLVLGVVFLPSAAARGPQMASRALSSVVGFSARNFSTQGTLRISRMFSRLDAGRSMRCTRDLEMAGEGHLLLGLAEELLEVGVIKGQMGHHQGVEDDAHAPGVREERVVGQPQAASEKEAAWAGKAAGNGGGRRKFESGTVLGSPWVERPLQLLAGWSASASGQLAAPASPLAGEQEGRTLRQCPRQPQGACPSPIPPLYPNTRPIMAHHPVFAPLFALLFLFSLASSESHYQRGDPVMLYVNKVGPYHNPQETYHYYQLPVCSPNKIRHKSLTLGEVLDGDRMAESMYKIRFRENVEKEVLCEMQLSPERVERLRQAIEELYYFEFVVDDLPLRGFVGYMEESGFLPHSHKIGLWTHLDFHFEWNGDRIIYANVSVRDVKPTSLDDVRTSVLSVTHTYSIRWSETTLERRGERRGSRNEDDGFFPRTLEIHWLSIINSMVLVFLLVGFVVVILMRVLKNDLARYNLDEEASSSSSGDDFDQGDNGWKIIHTDVFRFPACRSLLCAVLGVGSQFLALGTGIIIMALLGMFNVHRHGAINSAAILLYALTCCISGYVSSNFYRQIGGERWVWNILLTTSLFSAPFFLTWSVVNSVHWANGSTQALPVTTILLLLTVWLLVGFPLTVIGGIFGKNRAGPFDAPCRTKNIAREIPPQPWYKSTLVHMTIGGFLPFSAISVELYYIFATVWGREQYTLYGILFFVFAILLSVGACISIALTYFQLSGEDYRWWWRSVLSAGSTGLFIFLYSVFYYSRRSNMSGVVQTVEFFGYSLLTGYVFFLMLGTISFFASLKFIRYIYVNLKMD